MCYVCVCNSNSFIVVLACAGLFKQCVGITCDWPAQYHIRGWGGGRGHRRLVIADNDY